MGKRRTAGGRGCSIDGCDRPHEARSYCQKHYRRWKLYGDPLARAQRVYDLQCSADGCERPRQSGIWCTLHYQRVRKHGDANGIHYFRSIPRGGCVVEGCGRPPMHSSGMCEAHYKRWRTYGNTDAGINPGRCSSDGYIVLTGLRGHPFASPHGTTLEHRFVMATLLDRPLLPEETSITSTATVQITGQRISNSGQAANHEGRGSRTRSDGRWRFWRSTALTN